MSGIRTLQQLHDRCIPDHETGCLLWAGAMRRGACAIWIPDLGRATSMSPALHYIQHGKMPPPGRVLVPMCGNTHCANPKHRKRGTRGEMFALIRPTLDAGHKAKVAASRRAGSSYYCPTVAADIRSSTETLSVLGARHGMSLSHVHKVRTGQIWRDRMPNCSVFYMGEAA